MNNQSKKYINTFRMRIVTISIYFVFALSLWGILLRTISFKNYHVVSISENWTDETGAVCSL